MVICSPLAVTWRYRGASVSSLCLIFFTMASLHSCKAAS